MRKRYSEALEEFQSICRDVFGDKQVELIDNFIHSYINYRNNFIFSKRRIDVINDYAKAYLYLNISCEKDSTKDIYNRIRMNQLKLFNDAERAQALLLVRYGSEELMRKLQSEKNN